MSNKDEGTKVITREDRERTTDAGRLVSYLYADLEAYRDRIGLDEQEFINLSMPARKALIDAGAQFVNYDMPRSIGPGEWGSKTTMCVPPEWILEDEAEIKKTFDVFDFVKASNDDYCEKGNAKYDIIPRLVFKKGVGYPPVCIYELKDTKQNTQCVLLANLFDYVAVITKQTV